MSEGRGKKEESGSYLAGHMGSGERDPEVMDCTHLFSNASFIEVCLQKERN